MYAAFNAIKAICPHEARRRLYRIHAVTQDTGTLAGVSRKPQEKGRAVKGHGAPVDIIAAPVLARVHTLNGPPVKGRKTAPEALSA